MHQPTWSFGFPNERNQGQQAHPVLKDRVPLRVPPPVHFHERVMVRLVHINRVLVYFAHQMGSV